MVPNGWEIQSIESFCKVSSSKRIMQSDYVKEGVPFYRSKEIILKSKGIEPTDIIYIDLDKFAGLKDKFGAPEEGDILISAVGTLGKCYLVKKGEEFYFKDGNLLWLRELRGVEQLYLIQFMQSPYFQNEIQNMTGGSSQKALTIIKLAQMDLPLPPLPEQRKIAKILSTWDNAISTTERLINNSKQQKKALMQQLLTGKKRLLDDSGKPFEGVWDNVAIGDVVELFNGFAFKSGDTLETGCKWLKIANVGIGEIKWKDSSYLPEDYKSEYKKYCLKVGDIVVAMTRPTLGNQLKIARLKRKSDESLLNQRVAKLLFSDKVSCEYMYQLLSTIEVALKLNSALLGTDPPNLSAKVLHEIQMKMPPLVEQQKIALVLTNADQEIELLQQQLADLKQEKKALMQQLLTGKRRVKVGDEAVA